MSDLATVDNTQSWDNNRECSKKVCACKSTLKTTATETLQKQVAAEMDVADKPLQDLLDAQRTNSHAVSG